MANQTAREKAEAFLQETEFQLGALPTEQAHPRTRKLSQTIQADTKQGILMFQSVDQDLVEVLKRVYPGPEFNKLVGAFETALRKGKRVIFTGCGATGRLSILLEAACRYFWRDLTAREAKISEILPGAENNFFSVMAGGDYAFVRSVEGYEDYTQFGRQQIAETGVSKEDVVVAITEGGETSFVIGTAWEALEAGAHTFFVCNNPPDILAGRLKRSREVIEEPAITKLYLHSGPMAIAGSTRMQATSAELLVVGAALEIAFTNLLQEHFNGEQLQALGIEAHPPQRFIDLFVQMLDELSGKQSLDALAEIVELEESVYRRGARVTYFAHNCLVDLLTDTTERAPTFSLPPFRKFDQPKTIAPSWAFIKDPLLTTVQAWSAVLGRPPRCIEWGSETYRKLNAPKAWQEKPLQLGKSELMKFRIGKEDDPSRYEAAGSLAVLVLVDDEAAEAQNLWRSFKKQTAEFTDRFVLCIGPKTIPPATGLRCVQIPCRFPASPLNLWQHLGVKLVFNILSSATMARMGKVEGNWMIFVAISCKKLIDRGVRLVAELTGLSYREACYALYETVEEMERFRESGKIRLSPVARTVERVRQKQTGQN